MSQLKSRWLIGLYLATEASIQGCSLGQSRMGAGKREAAGSFPSPDLPRGPFPTEAPP